jgi:hypothetical protein
MFGGIGPAQYAGCTQLRIARGLALLFGIGTKALVWGFFSQEV